MSDPRIELECLTAAATHQSLWKNRNYYSDTNMTTRETIFGGLPSIHNRILTTLTHPQAIVRRKSSGCRLLKGSN